MRVFEPNVPVELTGSQSLVVVAVLVAAGLGLWILTKIVGEKL